MRNFKPALSALLLLPTGACSDLPARSRTLPVHEIEIASTDFAFRAPDTVPAGLTRIRLSSVGAERHHAQLARLDQGHTLAELGDSLTQARDLPSWVTFVGGPSTPVPGGPSDIVVDLEAGSYALICFVRSPDGVPHLAKGMLRALTVRPGADSEQPTPAADVRITLDDFTFALSSELEAGRRTIQVENRGPQPHEVTFVRLAPGKSAADVLAWLKSKEGPPPGETFGGTMALQTGRINYMQANFTRGDYALLRFVPDAGDGRPHVAHGMVHQITVQ